MLTLNKRLCKINDCVQIACNELYDFSASLSVVCVFVCVNGIASSADGATESRELELEYVFACVSVCVFTTNVHHKRYRPMGHGMKGLEQRMSCRSVLIQLVRVQ